MFPRILFHVLRLKPLENHRDRQARLAAYFSELVCVLFPIQETLFRIYTPIMRVSNVGDEARNTEPR